MTTAGRGQHIAEKKALNKLIQAVNNLGWQMIVESDEGSKEINAIIIGPHDGLTKAINKMANNEFKVEAQAPPPAPKKPPKPKLVQPTKPSLVDADGKPYVRKD